MKHVVFFLALLLGMAAVAADQSLVDAESDVQVKLTSVMECTHAISVVTGSAVGSMIGKWIAVRRAVSAVNNNQLEPLVTIVMTRATDKKFDVLSSEEYAAVKEALSHNGEFHRFGFCDAKRDAFFASVDSLLLKVVTIHRK